MTTTANPTATPAGTAAAAAVLLLLVLLRLLGLGFRVYYCCNDYTDKAVIFIAVMSTAAARRFFGLGFSVQSLGFRCLSASKRSRYGSGPELPACMPEPVITSGKSFRGICKIVSFLGAAYAFGSNVPTPRQRS